VGWVRVLKGTLGWPWLSSFVPFSRGIFRAFSCLLDLDQPIKIEWAMSTFSRDQKPASLTDSSLLVLVTSFSVLPFPPGTRAILKVTSNGRGRTKPYFVDGVIYGVVERGGGKCRVDRHTVTVV